MSPTEAMKLTKHCSSSSEIPVRRHPSQHLLEAGLDPPRSHDGNSALTSTETVVARRSIKGVVFLCFTGEVFSGARSWNCYRVAGRSGQEISGCEKATGTGEVMDAAATMMETISRIVTLKLDGQPARSRMLRVVGEIVGSADRYSNTAWRVLVKAAGLAVGNEGYGTRLWLQRWKVRWLRSEEGRSGCWRRCRRDAKPVRPEDL
ncbi:hypothetical protein HPP92_015614 [Vanilla planifolia]|uniref:Uncharacterized protein n=1 Tax=Vanilla planifolia TaxID=51239 RepID=A0A835URB7_VANPL|nr:hypothetical protein HPP92_015614 [Vanilla planifolia]